MSYDVDIAGFSSNYTYNLAPFFQRHIQVDGEAEAGIRVLNGRTGRDAREILARAFDSISSEYMRVWTVEEVGARSFCSKYDPPNGWGSTVGAMLFLAQLMAACAANPRHRVRVT